MTKYTRRWLGILLALAMLVPVYLTSAEPAVTAAAAVTPPTTATPARPTAAVLAATATATVAPDPTALPTDDAEVDALEPEATEEPTDDEIGEALAQESIVLNDVDGDPLDIIDGTRNILLAGLDARPGQTTGRSDTMIILTMDANNRVIKLTSLMRDMYVEIPGKGGNRINSAWVYGGPELLLKTIQKNFGITIDQYVAVNFSMLANVIDQIGGITLTVENKTQRLAINGVIQMDNKVLGLKAKDGFVTKLGEQLMTGKQAQAYARYRRLTKDGDFGRTVRQREVIIKCIDKLSEMSMSDLATLAAGNMDNVKTNLTLADILELLPAAFELKDSEIKELRIPADGAYSSKTIRGMSVLVPNLKKNKQLLADFING